MVYPLIQGMQEALNQSGLTVDDIDQAMGVTKSIFGLDWLESLAAKRKDMPNPLVQHPIIIGSASGSFPHLVELIELCLYLVSFKDDSNLSKIIAPMKDVSSYSDNLFQLAMAYRFKKLGFNVVLEPQILNGQLGDFSAKFGDMLVMAECTVLREWGVREDQRDVFAGCLNELKKLYRKTSKRFVVNIISTKSLSPENTQGLRKNIMRAGKSFLETGETSEVSDEFCIVTVNEMDADTREQIDADSRKFFNKLGDEGWDQILSFDLAPAKIPGDVTSVDLNQSSSRALMRQKSEVTPEDQFFYSLEDRLDKKAGGKIKQLKSCPPDHMSLLFIEVEDKLKDANFERIGKRLINNVFKKVPTLNAVFIAKRNWTGQLKHQYQGKLFSNPANPLNDNLILGFNTVERDINFVKEWQNGVKGDCHD